jgi:hypothetical protein
LYGVIDQGTQYQTNAGLGKRVWFDSLSGSLRVHAARRTPHAARPRR